MHPGEDALNPETKSCLSAVHQNKGLGHSYYERSCVSHENTCQSTTLIPQGENKIVRTQQLKMRFVVSALFLSSRKQKRRMRHYNGDSLG